MISVSLEHEFLSLIEDKEWWKLKSLLREVPAVDIAEWLEDLNADEALVVFRLLVNEKAADVFSYLSNTKGTELLDIFSKRQLSDVMTNLEPDEQVAFLEELPGRLTFKVLASLDPERKKRGPTTVRISRRKYRPNYDDQVYPDPLGMDRQKEPKALAHLRKARRIPQCNLRR